MSHPSQRRSAYRIDFLLALAVLATTVWVAHFMHYRALGLYEDDYFFVSGAWRWPGFLAHAKQALLTWTEGRPVNFFSLAVCSFAAEALGGLPLIYFVGFIAIALNASLFYVLLGRLLPRYIALAGALAFCLFPADTTHTLLTHALGLQPALTLFLIAALAYLSGRRIPAYFAIAGSLLTYESVYLVFLAVPLLRGKRGRPLVEELCRNAAMLFAILAVVVIARISMGDERLGTLGLGFSTILARVAVGVVTGPVVSLLDFVRGPARTILRWNRELAFVVVAFAITFTCVLRRQGIGFFDEPRNEPWTVEGSRSLAAGVVMLGLAYALSFTHFPPMAQQGRMTSVHLAAGVGGSLVFACASWAFVAVAHRFRLRDAALGLLSLYLSLVVAYRVSIQEDFVRAWKNQRWFWTSTVGLLPDIEDGTIVFVLDRDLPKTRYIESNSWADPLILGQLFVIPRHWQAPPRLFVVNSWAKELRRQGGSVEWLVTDPEPPAGTWSAHSEIIGDARLILLEMEDGRLVRRFGSIDVDGLPLQLKTRRVGAKLGLDKRPLYHYLIEE